MTINNNKNNDINNTSKDNKHYGLMTAISMIVGIVVGSGIFFKGDDVLKYTGGNVLLGVLVFCIGAFGIIFGSLTLIEFSVRTKKNGGVAGYFEDFISKSIASGFGWFQTFVYYPTLIAVIGWVCGIYTCSLLGLDSTLELEIILGLLHIVIFYVINIVSVKVGGYFQNLTTIIKLIPLLGIAIISIFWSAANPTIPEGVELLTKSEVGIGWLSALVPIAYSFDGWVVATSITNEVRNPRKNMTLALIIGPIIVLGVYILYFLGLNKFLGPDYILSTGDDAINKVGEILMGSNGSNIILLFITIAVMGVLNGVILGSLRMPQAIASKKMIPHGERVALINPYNGLSTLSCIISFISSVIWIFIHYITQKSGLLAGDISELSIVFSYICYVVLYIKVIKMKKDNEISSYFKGIICPIFAIIGSAIIFIGGIISSPIYTTVFILICILVTLAGYLYYRYGVNAG